MAGVVVRRAVVLGLGCAVLAFAPASAQAATITCKTTSSLAPSGAAVLVGTGTTTCDRPARHAITATIQTDRGRPALDTAFVGADADACDGCTTIDAQASTVLLGGTHYHLGVLDTVFAPEGSTIAPGGGCFTPPAFPSNSALCVSSSEYTSPGLLG